MTGLPAHATDPGRFDMTMLFLVRQPAGREPVVTDGQKNQGYLGKMYLNDMVFDTIERAQGYVRLPLGAYQIQMFQSPKLGRVLKVLDSSGKELAGKKNKIRIHAGSIPSHVEGCIAPGMRSASKNGLPLLGSRVAMDMILLACGDWQNGKTVGSLLVIEDHTPPNPKGTVHLLDMADTFSLHSLLKGL